MHASEHIIHATAGERVLNLGTLVTVKIPSAQTGNAFSVVEHVIPPQAGPPLHTHPETEVLYVLSGQFEFGIGSESFQVESGGIVYVPPGTPHSSRNVGERAGRLLSVYLPGAADNFFLEAGAPVTSASELPDLDQPADLSGVDMSHVLALAAKHGMHVVAS